MTKRTRLSLLVGILIIATFLRFYHLTTTPPGLYPDEAMNGNNAAEVAATGHFQSFYPEDNGREGLYVNLVAVLLYFHAPHAAWVVRLPAAIAGVLTVLGLYLLTADLAGDAVGLLAAFLLATSFWHIDLSRIGFRAILSPFFLVWSLYLLLRAFRAVRRTPAAWYAFGAGIVYALGFYTYIPYRVTPLLFLLFIPFFRRGKDFWKRTALFVAMTFIVAAPIGWYFVSHPGSFFGRTTEISVASSQNPAREFALNLWKTALMFNFRGDGNWRQNVSGAPELFWPVGIIFLVGIAWGLYAAWRAWRNRRKRSADHEPKRGVPLPFSLALIFSWFVLAALPAAASDEGIPHALRSILMLPPAMILAAFGGIWAYRFIEARVNKKTALALGALFLAAVAAFAYIDYFIIWAENPNVPGAFNADYVAIGEEINAFPPNMPKYVVVEAGGVIARGIPVPAETVMFITDSFTTSTQQEHDIHYLLPDQTNELPPGVPVFYIQ